MHKSIKNYVYIFKIQYLLCLNVENYKHKQNINNKKLERQNQKYL